MLISAGDLIALYLGLELMSLALYVVAAIDRDNVRSTEAGLKYFVLGALSSGMLLYGCFADLRLHRHRDLRRHRQGVRRRRHRADLRPGVPVRRLLLQGLGGAVPHVDAGRLRGRADAGHGLLRRRAEGRRAWRCSCAPRSRAFPGIAPQWQQIVVFVSIASMALGAFAAIGQPNIKRLMAYSSIGHMGFALVGLAAGTAEGVQGVLVYMAIYLAMTLGAFACILAMRRGDGMVEKIGDLAGLARTNPALAFFLAMLMFSLAGIPPLAGFFAKYYVFLAAIKAGLYVLAVIGVLASVVGAYYYLLIVKIMYFDEPAPGFEPMPRRAQGRARRRRPVQSPVLRLSGAAGRRRAGAAAKSLF